MQNNTSYFTKQNNFTISNLLIIISIIISFISFNIQNLNQFGMNIYYFNSGNYIHYILQYILYSFIHGNYMHLFSNILFIYLFGNIVENIITTKKFIIFFVFVTIFNGIGLSIFATGTTIGISGFALAILVYYTLELKSLKNPEYKGGITAIILNIGIGFMPGISLLGHLLGAIAGAIFYYINKDFFFKQKVGLITQIKQNFTEPKIIQPENITKKELEN